jgi:hypothetical protein
VIEALDSFLIEQKNRIGWDPTILMCPKRVLIFPTSQKRTVDPNSHI